MSTEPTGDDAQHDDELVSSSSAEVEQTNTGGEGFTPMTRRTLIKAGAAGAAAATLPGNVAASHAANDPLGINDDGTEATEQHDGQADVPVRIQAGAAVGGAFLPGGPALASTALGYDVASDGDFDADPGAVADYLFGDYYQSTEEATNEQLQTDIRAHAGTVKNELGWNIKQIQNRIDLAENNWIAQCKFAIIQGINAGDSKTSVVNAAAEALYSAATSAQKSMLAIEESVHLRHAAFNAREKAAGIQPDTTTATSGQVATYSGGYGGIVHGIEPVHITLLDGSTYETWALQGERVSSSNSGSPDGEVLHSHAGNSPYFLHPSYSRMDDLVEEATYDDGSSTTLWTSAKDGTSYTGNSDGFSHLAVYDQSGNAITLHPDSLDEWTSNNPDVISGNGLISHFMAYEFYNRVDALRSEVETLASDLHDAVAAGDINVDDLVTPNVYAENLARDWSTAGDSGHARGLAAYLGMDSSLKTSMSITVAESDSPSSTVKFDATDPISYGSVSLSSGGTVDVTLNHRAPRADTGDVVVTDDNGSVTVEVDAITDDPSAPTYVARRVDIRVSSQTAPIQVRLTGNGDGVGVGHVPHSDLDTDSTGSYTINQIDVVSVDGSGTSYTDTIDSTVGVTALISGHSYGVEYPDAGLATDWRPQDSDPDTWDTSEYFEDDYPDYQFSSSSGSADIRVAAFISDDSGGEYTVPSDGYLRVEALNSTEVTQVTVTTLNGTSHTIGMSSQDTGFIAHTTLDSDSTADYVIDTVEVTYDDGTTGAPYTDTVDSGIGTTVILSNTATPVKYDFLVNEWYEVASAGDNSVTIVTGDAEWVDIDNGDWFKISSATDADGNTVQGVTLSETNRHTLTTDRVKEELQRSVDAQQAIDETTGSGGAAGGGSGLGGSSLGALAMGGGVLGALYLWAKGGSGGSSYSRR